MILQNYLVIVIGEDDNKSSSITTRAAAEFQARDVAFVHAPMGPNTLVTMNGLHDALTNSTRDFVIVAIASAFDKADIESAVAKFEEEHGTSQKALLRKGFNSTNFEWRGQYDLASAIVVAKRIDLFDVLKSQMTQRQPHANFQDGESK